MSMVGGGVGAVPLGGSAAIGGGLAAPSTLAAGGTGLASATQGLGGLTSAMSATPTAAQAGGAMGGVQGAGSTMGDLMTAKNFDRGMQAYSLLGGGQGGQRGSRLQPPPLYQNPQQQRERKALMAQMAQLPRIGLGR